MINDDKPRRHMITNTIRHQESGIRHQLSLPYDYSRHHSHVCVRLYSSSALRAQTPSSSEHHLNHRLRHKASSRFYTHILTKHCLSSRKIISYVLKGDLLWCSTTKLVVYVWAGHQTARCCKMHYVCFHMCRATVYGRCVVCVYVGYVWLLM